MYIFRCEDARERERESERKRYKSESRERERERMKRCPSTPPSRFVCFYMYININVYMHACTCEYMCT